MATADFDTVLVARGTVAEKMAIVEALRQYTGGKGKDGIWFSYGKIKCGDKMMYAETVDLSALRNYLDSPDVPVEFSALGPYGRYSSLDETKFFETISEAAPNAEMDGRIVGSTTYTMQGLTCKLKDGFLRLASYFEANEETPEAYVDYFVSKLPLEKLLEIFELSDNEALDMSYFTEDDYKEFIDETCVYSDCDFADLEYDEFSELLNLDAYAVDDAEGACLLSKETFNRAMEKIRTIGIDSWEKFSEEYDGGITRVQAYDPVRKRYSNTVIVGDGEGANHQALIFEGDSQDASPPICLYDVYAILAGTSVPGESDV